MKCKNCGANIAEGLTECEYCGSIIDMSESKVLLTPTTQSFVSLLSSDEKKKMYSYISDGNLLEAQKFVMKSFGFNGEQASGIIDQIVQYNDAVIPNIYTLMSNLAPKSKSVFFLENADVPEKFKNAEIGARNKYLLRQGYTSDEKILLLYDNAVFKTGENGFTITDKKFYSSGSFLTDKEFVFALRDINKIYSEGSILHINERKTDITLVDSNDYVKACIIVSYVVHMNR